MKRENKARLMILSSMAIFGTLAPFVRNISVASAELALYRAVLASVIIGLFLKLTHQKAVSGTTRKELILLLASGVAMGFNWILLFEAYKYTSVSNATLSYYFAPVIVTLACPILFKEKMGAKQWICFVMSTLGIVLITGIGDLSGGSDHMKGILFGLSAACLYASVVLLNKFIKGVAGLHRTFLQLVSAAAVLLPYVALTDGFTLGALDASGWIYLLVVGLVHTGLAYCLYFSAIEAISGQQAAILSYVDPLVAIFVSVLLLGEGMTPVQALGGAMILGFTLWNELAPGRKKP
jgi:RarD protein